MKTVTDEDFFAEVPLFSEFEGVTDAANYRPLPDGWVLALADIVGSTQAIGAGRYKDVNMAGASVISAVLNAVGKGDYPFVFGGDGALIALPGSLEAAARDALAAAQVWVEEDLNLVLRVAIVPVADTRAEGLDVRVARYSASPNVTYAMFWGGGTSWAERQMKLGRYGIARAPAGTRPDLTGLSCRWSPIDARNGEIVSIIAVPGEGRPGREFQELVGGIVAITTEQNRDSHPVPADGPDLAFSLHGINREAKATAPPSRRFWQKLFIFLQLGITVACYRLGIPLGRFDARRYKRDVADNSDFRKFDDGLKMTIDVDAEHLKRIETLLQQAQAKGVARYGLHRQSSALMTCFVPTPIARDHIHFIDGAAGGYAVAASQITGKSLSTAPSTI
ncbi:DUF3095 domain-containing protein (plasmid) [Rhizobium ruizarguesonis]|jgi:hypothetical protein|uniref:DUF3095 domain-containing protein n=1 Tax=Rhizobium ruizarguesonis TaxID=2081791 RepID=A0AAE8Q8G2_9HYPH|nr:DUF3095 domain-containing protein [Rhizobium ruizarguesonis]MBY5805523.1 DUF3095 domain-containing protein [Rhizobium leguminosarum]NKL12224.1 DUF3095 family protein [Rhizobium leguminosarum bv. viciae]MBY5828470.1 DUF3095 domain-containing protein [Rhizobium leguminosarum]MBY5842406.1 DUF3095 domain-containing protein [Rhizobium leguminosarum]MBY5854539.1 DUF3095 domain-containing protein [Rhizobium leguminosarum]